MALRKIQFAPGEYYHLCGRGVGKQELFRDKKDWVRFLFLILYLQSRNPIYNISRSVTRYTQEECFTVAKEVEARILKKRAVELTAFALMPNHFHILVKELQGGGVPSYMHRVLGAYGRYFIEKHSWSGHVFQGPYRATHVASDEQLLYVSSYIHRNPRELKRWRNREHRYPWSSYQDYIARNRWNELLNPTIILDRFESSNEYQDIVNKSGAKEFEDYVELQT